MKEYLEDNIATLVFSLLIFFTCFFAFFSSVKDQKEKDLITNTYVQECIKKGLKLTEPDFYEKLDNCVVEKRRDARRDAYNQAQYGRFVK